MSERGPAYYQVQNARATHTALTNYRDRMLIDGAHSSDLSPDLHNKIDNLSNWLENYKQDEREAK